MPPDLHRAHRTLFLGILLLALPGGAQVGEGSGAQILEADSFFGIDPEESAGLGEALVLADFDGDGFDDLAAGAPWDFASDAETRSGAVYVAYGRGAGFAPSRVQRWDADTPGVPGMARGADRFGTALAAGDFNGDRYADLAIGAPFAAIDPILDAGDVTVLYGSSAGLRAVGVEHYRPRMEEEEGTIYFGRALAAGDFNADGYDDLALGQPCADFYGRPCVGGVRLFFGSAGGLPDEPTDEWVPPESLSAGLPAFGDALAVGDFEGDGYEDLVVGASTYETVGDDDRFRNTGAIAVLRGSPSGFLQSYQFINQARDDVIGNEERGDLFGDALAVADFDGDGLDDLAVGLPGESNEAERVGEVIVFRGSASGGVSLEGEQVWRQQFGGIANAPAEEDRWGQQLAAGDLNADGYADLVVGADRDDLDGLEDVGSVTVLYGGPGLLTAEGHQLFRRSDLPFGADEQYGRFGNALAVGDFDGGGLDVVTSWMRGRFIGQDGDVVALSNVERGPPDPGVRLSRERFEVTVAWRDFQGNTGHGLPVTLSDDSAVFYFFASENWELMVKVLDACALNDRYWVFFAATTNVHFTLRVTDTRSGAERVYRNPLGRGADAVNDTAAFATCP